MDIKEFEYIVAISEEKTLSKAAKRLCVSQPTLSNFLIHMEDDLGTDLFYRDKKLLMPTSAGKIYLEAAKKIISVRDQTYVAIHNLRQDNVETIRILATPLRGASLFATLYPQFIRRYPNIRLELSECYIGDMRRLLDAGDGDLGFGTFINPEAGDCTYIITSLEEVFLAAPGYYRDEIKPPVTLSQFTNASFVLMAEGTTVRSIFDSMANAISFHPLVVFESSNMLVVGNMIRQGAGVGLLPKSMTRIQSRDVVYFPFTPAYHFHLGLMMKKNQRMTEPIRYLAYLAMKRDREDNAEVYLQPLGNAVSISIWEEFDGQ